MDRSNFVPSSTCNQSATIEQSFRDDAGRALATLAKHLGDIEAAEDALQDAYLVALERWPRDGVPQNRTAWILATARNRAIDKLRRERRGREKLELLATLDFVHNAEDATEMTAVPDDRLGLMFACCHPGLAVEARVALTLRTLGGLETAEIADAFLVPEATMAQRLVRAKRKIREAAIPLDVPPAQRLPERLADVCAVLYLIFNEGYLASRGEQLVRHDLCEEAIRLGRILMRLMPQEPEVMGLLALMLYAHARRAARTGPAGELIPLPEQERTLWNRELIAEANALLGRAVQHRLAGAYQLEAMIAAEHTNAQSVQRVHWDAIARIYGELAVVAPSPVIDLNRAVAVSFADGPESGLRILDAIEPELLESYHPAHVARADFLSRLGRRGEAREAYVAALALTQNAAERVFIEGKVRDLDQSTLA
ncbi:MAG TPA: RNA polymerase sigma factor [Candidatus Baltobacteraceae bacterium]|jgi:RNA polymerase sigma-70 factor (ECF subfamily)